MSSLAVRDKFRVFLDANFTYPTTKFAEIDGEFENLKDFLANNAHPTTAAAEPITMLDAWNGLQYSADIEQAVSVPATNTTGTYRETGFIAIHVVAKAQINVARGILTRCKAFEDALRGQNIDGVLITSIIPGNFANGSTLDFVGGGYVSATVTVTYEYDRHL